jgi:hypothetical protein
MDTNLAIGDVINSRQEPQNFSNVSLLGQVNYCAFFEQLLVLGSYIYT